MTTLDQANYFIAGFEKFRATPYKPLNKDKWTQGFGTTIFNGRAVQPTDPPIDKVTALKWLSVTTQHILNFIPTVVKISINQNQTVALASLIYNIGEEAFATSHLLIKLNAKDYQGTLDQFMRWNHEGGVVVDGLTNRRTAECDLFMKGGTT
jgi:lysozyme